MTQTGCMARDDQYLTFGSLVGMLATSLLDRFACQRKGHDPVRASDTIVCRRCLSTVR